MNFNRPMRSPARRATTRTSAPRDLRNRHCRCSRSNLLGRLARHPRSARLFVQRHDHQLLPRLIDRPLEPNAINVPPRRFRPINFPNLRQQRRQRFEAVRYRIQLRQRRKIRQLVDRRDFHPPQPRRVTDLPRAASSASTAAPSAAFFRAHQLHKMFLQQQHPAQCSPRTTEVNPEDKV